MGVYMDNLKFLAQGSSEQQRRVTEMLLQGIKDIFPYLPSEIKDYVSLKKDQEGDWNWDVQKDILGCILDSEKGIFQLPSLRLKELKALLAISPSRSLIVFPKIRSLIGKL